MFILELRLDGNPILDSDPNCNKIKKIKMKKEFYLYRSSTCTRLFT